MKMQPRVERAIELLKLVIIDLLINSDGRLTIKELELWTGLLEVGPHITTEVVSYMARMGMLNIREGVITADISKLRLIKNKAKIKYPENHNKMWDDESIILLCEMALRGQSDYEIAKKLKRTENAILEMKGRLRFVWKTMPLVQSSKAVYTFCETTTKPKPDDSCNKKA